MSRRAQVVLAALLALLCAPVAARADSLLTGDHPDPTVARIGGAFYASATSGDWAPLFPLYRSTDLVNWTPVGSILPTAPGWTRGRFWAPELRVDRGHVTAFYSASRVGGPACIGVASAPRPEGPWRDRGQAACPPGGAIDPAAVTDVDGSRWLAWKQRGVRGGIVLQRLDGQGYRAVGRPIQLIRPDAAWERGVTEGPTFLHQGGWWYLLYSGGNCCRPPCTYAEGVARAPTLQGPYVKDPANPVLRSGPVWKCPGHGTAIDLGAEGDWFVHHAYRADDALDLRRVVLLDRIAIGDDGWPQLGDAQEPSATAQSPLGAAPAPAPTSFTDGFSEPGLGPGWQWPFDQVPDVRLARGTLHLACSWRTRFVARQLAPGAFTATAAAFPGGAAAGLAIEGFSGLRGVELVRGTVRQFAATGDRGAQVGPAVPVAPGLVRLSVSVDGAGALTATASVPGAPPVAVPPGPASAGPPPTRLALTCRGRGDAAFAFVQTAQSLR